METELSTSFKKNLLISLSLLIICGLIMVYSASYIFAQENFGDSLFFFKKQLRFLLIGLVGLFLFSRTKVTFWIKYAQQIHFLTTIILFLTFVPSLGVTIKGSSRWMSIAGLSFQPGELVKYSMLLASVNFFEDFENMEFKNKIKNFIFLIAPLLAFLLQPDFGSFSICLMVMSFIAFMSNFPRKIFYSSFVASIIAAGFILVSSPYRVKRLMAFLDPWENPKTSGFQIIQSYLAFANGSMFGAGIGNSSEKLFYLPEAHNDFIFSVIGEELGFVGVLVIVSLFCYFIYNGLQLANRAQEQRKKIFISAVIFIIGFQAFLNMGVVLGILPTKGLNLPFISAGGSSLMCNLTAIGLILSASRIKKVEDSFSEYSNFGNSGQSGQGQFNF